MNWLKRLYNWVIHWAETPYGTYALAAIAFAESSFFPVPPDVLLIPLCLGMRKKALRFALICSIASVTGGMFGYLIGWGFYETLGIKIVNFYHAQELFNSLCNQFRTYGFWAILVPALTPIPYKIFTISAGVAKIPLATFIIASILGRSIRFFIVAGLLRIFGKPIKAFIDKYLNILFFAFIILLIGGFAVIKLFIK